MNYSPSRLIALAAILAISSASAAPEYQGCYSSSGSLQPQRSETFQSTTNCLQHACGAMGNAVLATSKGTGCLCGNELPPKTDLVADSKCNTPCPGFPAEMCGGATTYSVYLTGEGKEDGTPSNSDEPSAPTKPSTAPSSSSSTVVPSSSVVAPSSSVVPSSTQAPSASSTLPSTTTPDNQTASTTDQAASTTTSQTPDSEPTSGSNKLAIPAGVMAGFAAVAGALFL